MNEITKIQTVNDTLVCKCIHCKRVKPWNATFFQYNVNAGPRATEFIRTCRDCSNARQRAYVKRWKQKRNQENTV